MEKAPVIALDGNLDQWEKLRDKYHQYYLEQFVKWLKQNGHPSRDTWHWEINRDSEQALLKEAGE